MKDYLQSESHVNGRHQDELVLVYCALSLHLPLPSSYFLVPFNLTVNMFWYFSRATGSVTIASPANNAVDAHRGRIASGRRITPYVGPVTQTLFAVFVIMPM